MENVAKGSAAMRPIMPKRPTEQALLKASGEMAGTVVTRSEKQAEDEFTGNPGKAAADHNEEFGAVDAFPATSNDPSSEGRDAEDMRLSSHIQALWADHDKKATLMKRTKETQAGVRAELGKLQVELAASLYQYKLHLAKPGRDGGWSSFLRESGIPRSTADRYANRHERSLEEAKNCSTGAITPTPPEDVPTMVRKLMPRLAAVLVTPILREQFLREITEALLILERSELSHPVIEGGSGSRGNESGEAARLSASAQAASSATE